LEADKVLFIVAKLLKQMSKLAYEWVFSAKHAMEEHLEIL